MVKLLGGTWTDRSQWNGAGSFVDLKNTNSFVGRPDRWAYGERMRYTQTRGKTVDYRLLMRLNSLHFFRYLKDLSNKYILKSQIVNA